VRKLKLRQLMILIQRASWMLFKKGNEIVLRPTRKELRPMRKLRPAKKVEAMSKEEAEASEKGEAWWLRVEF